METNKMNIIKVYNDKIAWQSVDDRITVTCKKGNPNKILVTFHSDSTLKITWQADYKNDLAFSFQVEDNVKADLIFFKKGRKTNHFEEYEIGKEGILRVGKISDTEQKDEEVVAFLNGKNAKIYYVLKTLCKDKEQYNMKVYHNREGTSCVLYNHGINYKEGMLSFHVSNIVPKNIKYTFIDQNSQIITLNHKKCEIKPILLIDENEVEASHSAHIGTFDEESLFYLQSRGIKKEKAYNLLLKGFLHQKLFFEDEKLAQMIDQYWR